MRDATWLALFAAVALVTTLAVAWFAGGLDGATHSVRTPAQVRPVATDPPWVMSCDHGVRVYTTPQGGIATALGGVSCP